MGFFGRLLGKEDRDDSFDLGKDAFANDSQGFDAGLHNSGTGSPMGAQNSQSFGSQGYSGSGNDAYGAEQDPFANPEPSSRGNPFGDPMGSNFGPDPSMSKPATATGSFPSAVPIPGQNRAVPMHDYDDEAPSRDVELILAKLDAIKAELDSVHQRVRKLEQVSDAQQQAQAQQQHNSQVHQKYGW